MAISPDEKRQRRIMRFFEKFQEWSIGKCLNNPAGGVASLNQKLVRLAHANDQGVVQCVTCGKPDHYSQMNGGHYVSRTHKAAILDIDNVWPQCVYCNQHLSGNLVEFRKFLIRTIGEGGVAHLETLKHSNHTFTKYQLAEMKVNILDEIKMHEKRLAGK